MLTALGSYIQHLLQTSNIRQNDHPAHANRLTGDDSIFEDGENSGKYCIWAADLDCLSSSSCQSLIRGYNQPKVQASHRAGKQQIRGAQRSGPCIGWIILQNPHKLPKEHNIIFVAQNAACQICKENQEVLSRCWNWDFRQDKLS